MQDEIKKADTPNDVSALNSADYLIKRSTIL